MAVTSTFNVGTAGLFRPFRTPERADGGPEPVGTLHVPVNDVGDATGGAVTISIAMRRQEFGFHPLWIPTWANSRDNLATAEAVALGIEATGNERLAFVLEQAVLATARGSTNIARFDLNGVLIDPDSRVVSIVASFTWTTNTDTKIYRGQLFGPVYDGEVIARLGGINSLLAGLR